jgi:hypothetical protein
MSSTRHDDQFFVRTFQFLQGIAIHGDYWFVVSSDDQKRWCANHTESASGKIRPAPTRHDRGNNSRQLGSRHKGSTRPGTSSEITNFEVFRERSAHNPAGCAAQALCKQRNVETKLATELINGLFFVGQKVKQESPNFMRLEYLRHVLIARAMPAAATSMGEKDYALCGFRNSKGAFQAHSIEFNENFAPINAQF